MLKWISRHTDRITTASMVEKHLNSKKRKAWVL